ncbi:hypothetical protein BGW36DRAFT_349157 [Talaromyces proteolyticus]|uniref:Pentatricopeptide repeat protein n=1 Tax=Talaromyces proteolyticus TaxID=1131652 RepID=A0AAD4KG24_9EURO|nr:uncharacterized protein BGW36DRAFT_349157 [Talaromyces proteolyticus]KAH8691259.1 hypothetical protein BGW36DRAFT_349157 [Talaromyces proteolyticus]
MLSYSVRRAATGARFGLHRGSELILRRNNLAVSHTTVQQLRKASSTSPSISEYSYPDTRSSHPFEKWPRSQTGLRDHDNDVDYYNDDVDGYTRHRSKPRHSSGISNRGLRLSENLDYVRRKTKKQRRDIEGSREEVDMLMELAKSRNLPESISSTVVNKELRWLKDPKDLAVRTARLLAAGQVQLAVALVRKAEMEKMECSVAWNRLLDYCFKRGAPLAAFKFYNDMKKRGRRPTDRTYTIMLKGLSLRSRQIGVKPVETAYKIYKQVLDPRSGVQASHFHHHPMLEVCGNYHDMDALWNVVGELPEHGPSKPNAQTYTIILLALRNNFDHETASLSVDDVKTKMEKRENMILDAKRIWADVKNRWEAGQLEIDTELAGTMAFILTDPLDELNSFHVLSLFNQTAGIPVFADKPSGPSMVGSRQGIWEDEVRRSRYQAKKSKQISNADYGGELTSEQDIDSRSEAELDAEQASLEHDDDSAEEKVYMETFEDIFDPVKPQKNDDTELTLLKPDNMILNRILKTCRILTKGTAAGKEYWKYFTLDEKGHKLEPDEANFHEYLRVLRVSRSSQGAVDLIRNQMLSTGFLEGKTFHIAMSCCLRDRQNPNVLLNAKEMLAIMDRNLPLPDPRPLTSFLELSNALLSNPQWLLRLRGLEDIDQSATNLTMMGRNLRWSLQKSVVASLEPHINRLYDAMEHAETLPDGERHASLSPAIKRPGTVNGFLCVNLMMQMRQSLDSLLGAQYEKILTDSERKWIHALAVKLRKYSKPDVVKQFEKSTLKPLESHWEAIRETAGR